MINESAHRRPTEEPLASSFPVTTDEMERLHQRLADTADRDGTLDVAYRTLDTPVGELLLAATDRGLIRVAYPSEGHDTVLQSLADRISPRVLRAPARLDHAAVQLDEYFTGTRQGFDLSLDRRLSAGFRRAVLEVLSTDVGYGSTASYGALARRAGRPAAARAVGTACATNPLPVIVPCHRVVRADGTLGDYVGGSAAKRKLLVLEGAA